MIEFLCGVAVGALAVYIWEEGKPQPQSPRVYNVQVSQASTMRLHYIGKLDERQFKLLCYWVTDGRPFRLLALQKAKVLTRSQFEEVRGELVGRGLAYKNTNRTVDITPPGYAFFRWGAGITNTQMTNK